jgi:hypothetical protein
MQINADAKSICGACPQPQKAPQLSAFYKLCGENRINNTKLRRILTPYLPANQPFHANREFPIRGGAEPSPSTHEDDTGRSGAGGANIETHIE